VSRINARRAPRVVIDAAIDDYPTGDLDRFVQALRPILRAAKGGG
jgi:hypothetical protein